MVSPAVSVGRNARRYVNQALAVGRPRERIDKRRIFKDAAQIGAVSSHRVNRVGRALAARRNERHATAIGRNGWPDVERLARVRRKQRQIAAIGAAHEPIGCRVLGAFGHDLLPLNVGDMTGWHGGSGRISRPQQIGSSRRHNRPTSTQLEAPETRVEISQRAQVWPEFGAVSTTRFDQTKPKARRKTSIALWAFVSNFKASPVG